MDEPTAVAGDLRRRVADRLENSHGVDGTLYALLGAATAFGAAHHVDHLVRGNHVGWPATPPVNAFTFSLGIYPLIAVGRWLSVTDRAGAGYWAAFSAGSAAVLVAVHFGPGALEPPAHVIGPHDSVLAGYAAMGVLLALLGAVTAGGGYAFGRWRVGR